MNKKTNKNRIGCLWLFLITVFTIIGFGVLESIFRYKSIFLLIVAIGLAIVIVNKMIGRPPLKTILGQGVVLFFILFCFIQLSKFLSESLTEYNPPEPVFIAEEGVKAAYIIENKDTVNVFSSNRVWRDNYGKNYSTSLTVRERDFLRLENHINTYKRVYNKNFWGNLYHYIEQKDTPSLDLIMEAFSTINESEHLNQREFAEMVVSCIQDIPYSLVFQGECLPASSYEDSAKRVLTECPDCCIGNIKYGIQNPISFMQNLKGDCDTRTVIIYSILKYFKYDVAILNSNFYRHSILGVNLPASGIYKVYKGKKYMLWETTAKYYEIGKLSRNFDDVNHWEVVLTSQ